MPSPSPGPSIVKIVCLQGVRALDEGARRVAIELDCARLLFVAHRGEERSRHLAIGGHIAERLPQRCGPRHWRLLLGQERGELHLIVVDEYRSVLEKGTVATPLRATNELTSIESDFAHRRKMKTREKAGLFSSTAVGIAGDVYRADAHQSQSSEQQTIDSHVRFAQIAGVVAWCGDCVGD